MPDRLGPGRRAETRVLLYVRVVRFTNVTADHLDGLLGRVEESGPPSGVPVKGLQILFDEAQGQP
jgi:hypothetical protein